MNEEYLWAKKGSDPEIQGLENLLSEFRFAAGTPPELPATNIIPFVEVPKRRFVWSFAFAASVAVVMTVAWLVRQEPALISERQNRQDPSEVTFVQPVSEPVVTFKDQKPEEQPVPALSSPTPAKHKAKPPLRKEPKATLTAS